MADFCAGQSEDGMAFSAQYADYNFCFGKGVNTPTAFVPKVTKLQLAAAKARRSVTAYALFMVIADEAARAKWERYKAGTDQEAVAWLVRQSTTDQKSREDTNVRQMVDPVSVVNINMGTIVGSYPTVARLLDEIDTFDGCDGVLLTFDDFARYPRFWPSHPTPDEIPPACVEVA